MKQVNFNIPEEKNSEFRQLVIQKKGFKHGNITEAFIEAIDLWINKNKDE